MTRARDFADVISGQFDIPVGALDNVPASNDASALTTGTLPAARLPATIDGRDLSVDGAKLDGIEANATANQTATEIKTAYESNGDTNAFSDALLSKLNGIAAGATNVTNTNQLTNGAGFVTTDTNTTYSAGNGLSLSGTQFNLGGNAVKQHIMSQPNVGILSKSGGWQEVHTSMRVSIACTGSGSRLLIRYTFTFGGNNSGQIAAFKIRDITGGFDVNMNTWQNRAASHGTTRHVDTDVNDVEQLVVAAVVEASQTSTSARTYTLYFKNEGNGGTTKYFNGWAQNLTQGFYNKPICEIMEL